MWHTGTLDPLATGWMLLAVWNYTKLIPYLEKASKIYEFTVMLNWTTSSLDLAEEIEFISEKRQVEAKKHISQELIQKIIDTKFTGEITQVPPKYSAIKIDWKRAYELARKGEDVKMKERTITILKHEIISFNYPELKLRANVSAGTYIRTIAGDLWNELWTGGYVSVLRRTQIWWLDISKSTQLEQLEVIDSTGADKILDTSYFLENFNSRHLSRLNDWLERIWKFDLEIDKNYFIYDGEKITNVIRYDWEKIIPIKKIC